MTDLTFLLNQVLLIAQTAGQCILQIYHDKSALNIDFKPDQSPVTQADIQSHRIIEAGLKKLKFYGKQLPILSEEGTNIPFEIRQQWQTYWLVDPLDGTREFIEKTDEFAINIALIHEHHPILGLVYHPCKKTAYYGINQQGAYIKPFDHSPTPIYTTQTNSNPIRIALSRHHANGPKHLFESNENQTLVFCGSALKICLVAEGSADVYPRLGPTSEWDTAAGHCILKEAGGALTDLYGQALRYNTKSELINPSFIAVGNSAENWTQKLNLLSF